MYILPLHSCLDTIPPHSPSFSPYPLRLCLLPLQYYSRYEKIKSLLSMKRCEDRWSHVEDLDLLKGYQRFGDKWHLIGMFYLPKRKHMEIKNR